MTVDSRRGNLEVETAHRFPLSFAQQRLAAASPFAKHVLRVRLSGRLDRALVEHCAGLLGERHEPLRTTLKDGAQVVFDAPGAVFSSAVMPAEVAGLNGLGAALARAEMERILADAVARGENRVRITLLCGAAELHWLQIASPAPICDEISLAVLFQELAALYRGESLAPAGLQYPDFAVWQREVHGAPALAVADPPRAAAPVQVVRRSLPVRLSLESIAAAVLAVNQERAERHSGVALWLNRRQSPELAGVIGPMTELDLGSVETCKGDPVRLASLLREAERGGADGPGLSALSAQPYERLRSEAAAPLAYTALAMLPEIPAVFAPGVEAAAEWLPAPDPDVELALYCEAGGVTANLLAASMWLGEQQLQAYLDRLVQQLGVTEKSVEASGVIVPPADPVPACATPVPAQDSALEARLCLVWAEIFGLRTVTPQDNFFDLGGHSLLAVKLATRIERAMNIEVPLHAILERPTVAEFAAALAGCRAQVSPAAPASAPRVAEPPQHGGSYKSGDGAHALVSLQPEGALAPLYWIPGGRAISVMALREVSLQMGSDRPVFGIESRLPQPGERFLSVEERARIYVELVRRRQPEGPYHLAGFCMGGMVAFEMAQQLRAAGERVAFLAMVQASVPGRFARRSGRRRMHWQHRRYILGTLAAFCWMRLKGAVSCIPRAKHQAMLDRVAALLTGWVSTSSQLPDGTQDQNQQQMNAYCPSPYAGSIDIYIARDCFESAGISAELDPRRRWSELAAGGSMLHELPGNHSSILQLPYARNLAESMRGAIVAAESFSPQTASV